MLTDMEPLIVDSTSTSADSGSGKEGVRLWVSGLDTPRKTLLIDQWDGLDTSYEATVGMLTSRLYDIVVEYRDTQSTSSMKLGEFILHHATKPYMYSFESFSIVVPITADPQFSGEVVCYF